MYCGRGEGGHLINLAKLGIQRIVVLGHSAIGRDTVLKANWMKAGRRL